MSSDPEPEILPPSQSLDITETARRAHGRLWRKGESGNPGGMPRAYYRARELARLAAPDMIENLIELAKNGTDERVRSFCCVAVLDRGGVKPIDYDPNADPGAKPMFDVEKLSPEERDALRKMIEKATAKGE